MDMDVDTKCRYRYVYECGYTHVNMNVVIECRNGWRYVCIWIQKVDRDVKYIMWVPKWIQNADIGSGYEVRIWMRIQNAVMDEELECGHGYGIWIWIWNHN